MNMDEQYRQRVEERAMEMIRSGEFGHMIPDRGARLGRNNQDDRSLRYSIRDIPTFDGKGDSLPHTNMLEFGDFLANTGSEIRYLPQEPQAPKTKEAYGKMIASFITECNIIGSTRKQQIMA